MKRLVDAQELLFLYEHLFSVDELKDARAELFYVLTVANIPPSGYVYDFMRLNFDSVPTNNGWRTRKPISAGFERLEHERSFLFSIRYLAQSTVFGCRPQTFTEQVQAITSFANESGVSNISSHLDYIYTCLNEQAHAYEVSLPAELVFLNHSCTSDVCKKRDVNNGAPRIAFLPEPEFVRPNPQVRLAKMSIYAELLSVYQVLETHAMKTSVLLLPLGSNNNGFSVQRWHIRAWRRGVTLAMNRIEATIARNLQGACTSRLQVELRNIVYGKAIRDLEQCAQQALQTSTQHPYRVSHAIQSQASSSSGPQTGSTAQAFSVAPNSGGIHSRNWRKRDSEAGPSTRAQEAQKPQEAQDHHYTIRDLLKDSIIDDGFSTLSMERR